MRLVLIVASVVASNAIAAAAPCPSSEALIDVARAAFAPEDHPPLQHRAGQVDVAGYLLTARPRDSSSRCRSTRCKFAVVAVGISGMVTR